MPALLRNQLISLKSWKFATKLSTERPERKWLSLVRLPSSSVAPAVQMQVPRPRGIDSHPERAPGQTASTVNLRQGICTVHSHGRVQRIFSTIGIFSRDDIRGYHLSSYDVIGTQIAARERPNNSSKCLTSSEIWSQPLVVSQQYHRALKWSGVTELNPKSVYYLACGCNGGFTTTSPTGPRSTPLSSTKWIEIRDVLGGAAIVVRKWTSSVGVTAVTLTVLSSFVLG